MEKNELKYPVEKVKGSASNILELNLTIKIRHDRRGYQSFIKE